MKASADRTTSMAVLSSALAEAVLSAAKGNSHTAAPPAAVLWPDKRPSVGAGDWPIAAGDAQPADTGQLRRWAALWSVHMAKVCVGWARV